MRSLYASELTFTTGVSKEDIDSGGVNTTTGETSLVAASFSDTDAGAGVDDATIERTTVALEDLGVGQDTASVSSGMVSDDTGSGSERATGEGSYQLLIASDSPMGYWRLGEATGTVAYDFMGNHDGEYIGSPVLGAPGALYDNTDTSVEWNTSTSQYGYVAGFPSPTDSLSVEAWVRVNSTADGAIMERSVINSSNTDWALFMEAGRFSWRVSSDTRGVSPTVITSFPPVLTQAVGNWTHIVGTLRLGTMRLYVNGNLVSTGSVTRTLANGAGNLFLARLASATVMYKLDGRLDEPAVYNYALSPTQILKHYEAGIHTISDSDTGTGGDEVPSTDVNLQHPDYESTVLNTGPAGYWRLGEPEGSTTATDATGNGYNASHQSDGVSFGRRSLISGDSNTSATFFGAHTGLDAPSGPPIPNGFTVSAWIQLDREDSGDRQSIISYGEAESTGFVWAAKHGAGANQPARLWVNHGGVWPSVDYTTILSAGSTYHLAATYDATTKTVKLYVNGNLEKNVSNLHANPYSPPSGNLTIGARDSRTIHRFQGGIDEPTIYDRVLTADEIQQHYNVGSGLVSDDAISEESSITSTALTQSDTGTGAENAVAASNEVDDADTGTGMDLEVARAAILSDTDTVGGEDSSGTIVAGGATTDSAIAIESQQLAVLLSQPDEAVGVDTEYKVRLFFDLDSNDSVVESEVRTKLASIIVLSPPHTQQRYDHFVLDGKPVGYWRLGETEGTVAVDSSGNGNDGAYVGMPTLSVPGALVSNGNTAAGFDGVDDSVSIPDSSLFDVASFTIEAWINTANAGAGRRRIWSQQLSGSYYLMALNGNVLEMGSSRDSLLATRGPNLADSTWHHVAVIRDTVNGAAKWYVDGAEVGTANITDTVAYSIAEKPYIGRYYDSMTEHFSGIIDEVAVYNSALSTTEIKRHYDVGSASRYGFGAVEPQDRPSIVTDDVDAYQFDWATTPA